MILSIIIAILSILIIVGFTICHVPDPGSLIGGSLGGIGTLLAVMITLIKSDKNKREEIAIINKPYFKIDKVKASSDRILDIPGFDPESPRIDIPYNPSINGWWHQWSFDNNNQNQLKYIYIVFQNVGLGPAINVDTYHENNHKLFYFTSAKTDVVTVSNDVMAIIQFPKAHKTLGADSVENGVLKVGNRQFSLKYKSINGIEFQQIFKIETKISDKPENSDEHRFTSTVTIVDNQ